MIKSSTLIKRFRKFWDSLTKQEQDDLWNILTTLRGEDEGNHTLKLATTARIRAELFGMKNRRVEAFFCSSLVHAKLFTDINITPLKTMTLWDNSSSHFRHHVLSAIRALNSHVPKRRVRDLQKFLR